MMNMDGLSIPKIDDDKKFERLSRDLLKNTNMWNDVQIHGSPGQKQDGVDVYAVSSKNNKHWIGIQCKVRSKNDRLTKSEMLEEIEKAKNFIPHLKEYYFYTTQDRDVHTQKELKAIVSNENLSFKVEIKFWDDITELLKEEKNLITYSRYYSDFFVDSYAKGLSIGKLFSLLLGTDEAKPDTGYELIIGKLSKPDYPTHDDPKNYLGINYYKDGYYIMNLQENTSGRFKPKCYVSDLEGVFRCSYDCFRIVTWINSFEDFNEFVYDDNCEYSFNVSDKQRTKYLQSLK